MPTNAAAPTDPVNAADLSGSTGAYDLSIFGLFAHADPIVQTIMLLLLVASIWCWAIIIEKTMRFKTLKVQSDRFEHAFWSSDALDQFHEQLKKKRITHPMAIMFGAAMEEWFRSRQRQRAQVSASNSLKAGMRERIAQMMAVARNRELDKLERGIGFLGTAGSSAPFVGLLGTVWGIMHSFTSIAASKNTSLAVVAPGIAEALLATALGLFVAIPAVIAYNKLSNELSRFAGRMEDFGAEFSALIGRQMEGDE